MKLKPRTKTVANQTTQDTKPVTKRAKKEALEDRYSPEFPPLEMTLSDKYKLIFTVQRDNDGDGLLELDIRVYQTTDLYTGFTRKGVRIPLEKLSDLEDTIDRLIEKCEALELMSEAYDYADCGAREFTQ